MLPHSNNKRKRRDRDGKVDGRTTEIQRLIGRSLRAVVDLQRLGERTLTVDCDVLQADGGTRTASITGGFLAMCDALYPVFGGSQSIRLPIAHSSDQRWHGWRGCQRWIWITRRMLLPMST